MPYPGYRLRWRAIVVLHAAGLTSSQIASALSVTLATVNNFLRRADVPRSRHSVYTYPGSEYSTDDVAYLRAVDAYRRRHGLRFLTALDYRKFFEESGWEPKSPTGIVKPCNLNNNG